MCGIERGAVPLLEQTLAAERQQTVFATGRVLSVDVLRGLTLAFMILVNDPGDWKHVFRPLDHADWNGWTLTDLVFPTFLFCMGAAMVFSLGTRAGRGDSRGKMAGHVLRRGVKLFAAGMAVNLFPLLHWRGMRIFGVLTRLALCYVLGGLIVVWTRRPRALIAVVCAILLGYWVLLRWVPVPGYGLPGRDVPFMDQTANVVSWVDRGASAWMLAHLHVGSLYRKVRDPEGLLSTVPATVSVLLGVLAGLAMRRSVGGEARSRRRMQGRLILWGFAGVVAGEIWSAWFPINKNLWTSSYVLLAAGVGTLVLAGFSVLVDGRAMPWPGWLRAITWPWLVFGSNAIVALLVSDVLVKSLIAIRWVASDGSRHTALGLLYQAGFARSGSTEWTSLAWAICFVVVCFLPNWWLWQRRIFVRL